MPIDDPLSIELKYAKENLESQEYIPEQLVKLGLSASVATYFASYPFISQILISLIPQGRARFEKRCDCFFPCNRDLACALWSEK
jgi:hypothetical protein